jgi:hypothetical protein
MAEARIAYGGRGELTEVQHTRWGQQLMDIHPPCSGLRARNLCAAVISCVYDAVFRSLLIPGSETCRQAEAVGGTWQQ